MAALNQVRWNIVAAELTNMATTEKLYFTALYQRDLRDLARRAAELNEQLARSAEKRVSANVARPGEETTARVSLRQARKQAALAEANYAAARLALMRQLNLPVDQTIDLVGRLEEFSWNTIEGMAPNAGQGAWSAFWLASVSGIPSAGSKGYEVDIVEAYGGQFKEAAGGDKYNWVVHPWNADGSQAPQPYEGGEWAGAPGGDAITNWHIYGCKVTPDFITFHIDGQEVGRKPTNLEYLEEPLYIIINYALQQPLSGEPFVSKGSSALKVDWVRAYSLPSDSTPTPPPPPSNLRVP